MDSMAQGPYSAGHESYGSASRVFQFRRVQFCLSLSIVTTSPNGTQLVPSNRAIRACRLSFLRPSRLLPGDLRFRHFARFHRHLLQAIDKPSAGGSRR
jgi:hypothetical protein